MKRIVAVLSLGLFLALIISAVAALWWLTRTAVHHLMSMPQGLGAALIAGFCTIVVSTLTVVLARYYERTRELSALHRDKKILVYDEFLEGFFNIMNSNSKHSPTVSPPDIVTFLRGFTRKLLLWGSQDVINAFVKWQRHLMLGVPDARTIWLTQEFLLAIRADLGHRNNKLDRGLYATILLSEPTIFLEMAAKNPSVTLAEVSAEEKRRQSAASTRTS